MTADMPVLIQQCASEVHPATMAALVRTESAENPFAIGVVGGRLERQPRNLREAVATAHQLEARGFNFSVGAAQVNRFNLARFGLTYETAFDLCRNLKAGSSILSECFQRAQTRFGSEQEALRAALSCYYSGNFTTGLKPDVPGGSPYVAKVYAAAGAAPIPVAPAVKAASAPTSVDVTRKGGPRGAESAPQLKEEASRQGNKAAGWDVFGEFSK